MRTNTAKTPEKIEKSLQWFIEDVPKELKEWEGRLNQMLAQIDKILQEREDLRVPAYKARQEGFTQLDPIDHLVRRVHLYRKALQELQSCHYHHAPYPKLEAFLKVLNEVATKDNFLEQEAKLREQVGDVVVLEPSAEVAKMLAAIDQPKKILQKMTKVLERVDKGLTKELHAKAEKGEQPWNLSDFSLHGLKLYHLSLTLPQELQQLVNHSPHHHYQAVNLLDKMRTFVPHLKTFNKHELALWQKVNADCLRYLTKEKSFYKNDFVDFAIKNCPEVIFKSHIREILQDLDKETKRRSMKSLYFWYPLLRERVESLLHSPQLSERPKIADQLRAFKARIILIQLYFAKNNEEGRELRNEFYRSLLSIKHLRSITAHDQLLMAEYLRDLDPDSAVAKQFLPNAEALQQRVVEALYQILKNRQGLDDNFVDYASALFQQVSQSTQVGFNDFEVMDVDDVDHCFYLELREILKQVKANFLSRAELLSVEQGEPRQPIDYSKPHSLNPSVLSALKSVINMDSTAREVNHFLASLDMRDLEHPHRVIERLQGMVKGTPFNENPSYKSALNNLEHINQLNTRVKQLVAPSTYPSP